MNEFQHQLIGDATPAQFISALLYAYITAFGMLMYKAANRNPARRRTPYKFSWNFFFDKNALRIGANIIFILITVRFSQEVIGAERTVYTGFLIGLLGDGLAKILISFTPKHKGESEAAKPAPAKPVSVKKKKNVTRKV